jgi:hypothetical protein
MGAWRPSLSHPLPAPPPALSAPPASEARSEPQASGAGTVTQLVAPSWKWRCGQSGANPSLAVEQGRYREFSRIRGHRGASRVADRRNDQFRPPSAGFPWAVEQGKTARRAANSLGRGMRNPGRSVGGAASLLGTRTSRRTGVEEPRAAARRRSSGGTTTRTTRAHLAGQPSAHRRDPHADRDGSGELGLRQADEAPHPRDVLAAGSERALSAVATGVSVAYRLHCARD